MPCPSNCKLQVASRKQNENGSFSRFQEQQQELIVNDDDQIQEILEEDEEWTVEYLQEFQDIIKRLELVWKEDASKNKRVYYNSTPRTTQWCKQKATEELKEHAKSIAKIDTFFQPLISTSAPTLSSSSMQSTSLTSSSLSIPSTSSPSFFFSDLHECLEYLNNHCKISKSNNSHSTYEYIQLLSLSQYYQLCLNGMGKMDASLQVARNFWRKSDYMST